jgi:hypothetical protein
MANLLVESLLGGQKVQQGEQAIQQNQQTLQQQTMLQNAQNDAQSIFEFKNLLSQGATDDDMLTNISQKIQQGQEAGIDVSNLMDAGNILQSQGRDAFMQDLEGGVNHLNTLQQAGLIDLPGLRQQKVQSSVAVPGGTRQISNTGKVSFTPRSEEEVLATATAESEKLQRSKQSKLELESGIANIEERKQINTQLNKDRSARVKKFRQGADSAREVLPSMDKILNLLKTAETGSFAEQKMQFKRLFKGDVANEEALQSAVNDLVLQQAQKMSGALSKADLDFLINSTANLGKTVEGNVKIINDMKQLANHVIGVNRKFGQFRKKKGNDPLDFEAPVFQVTSSGQAFKQPLSPEQKQTRKAQLLEELRAKKRGN